MPKSVIVIFTLLLASPLSSAQKRIETGVFLDYLGVSATSTSNFGIGGRFGYRIHRDVMFEGEFAYDYGINFDELYLDAANGDLAAIEHTSIGVTHGLFGPKLQPVGRFRPFVTLKAGFIDFRFSPSLLPYSNIVSAILGLRESTLNPVIYPGGGLEAALGPLGFRFELGDEVYFNHGAHNNLRITIGPFLRF
ncbi:MAG TPA: hypothetical protein VL156_07980 [Terriglobales bacterium]|jgi:hypothetical protein|nr:hypothetical protein [Terriglobales bacterium]